VRMGLTAVLIWLLAILGQGESAKILRGSVVDQLNRPIAGAVLCPEWGMGQNGALAPIGPSATTDRSGRFSLEITPGFTDYHGRVALLAFDPSRKLGAFIDNREQEWTQPIVIHLMPVHQVRYAASVEGGGQTSVGVYSQTDMVPIPSLPGNAGTVALPPGMYELRASASETIPAKERFTVENSDVNLPALTLKLELSPMTRHYGHGTPTLSPVTDLDHRSLNIGPLRGHWTFLYFWADWCVPCVAEGIPKVNQFVLNHRDQQSQFRVIAIHRKATGETVDGDWNDFRAKTLQLEKSVWHFVPAFPLAFDRTTRMTTDWGIQQVPTTALIDPKGNLVRDGSLDILAKELDRERHPTGK
jgi:thiol-disulfide isomerase/thioredoxin